MLDYLAHEVYEVDAVEAFRRPTLKLFADIRQPVEINLRENVVRSEFVLLQHKLTLCLIGRSTLLL